MNIPGDIIKLVDIERLYTHVRNLEGERHPITNPEGLRKAQEYISTELRRYGVRVQSHTFTVDGYSGQFQNVEGVLGDATLPSAALLNHYDTFYGTTGANDNAVAVAIALEAARILATLPDPPTVRFLSFTLEEENPAFQKKLFDLAHDLGLVDERRRYTSNKISQVLQIHDSMARARWQPGLSMGSVNAHVTKEINDQLTPQLKEYLDFQADLYCNVTFLPGTFGHLGSWKWMDDAIANGKLIKYGICMDEVGRTIKGEGHQVLPPGFPLQLAKMYRVDPERLLADWAFLVSNGPADLVGNVFCEYCRAKEVDLPYLLMHIPMDYEGIKANFPQTLGSDYSALWRENIPALALFDSAGWRTPYFGHTYEDTIEKLDFDQIGKLTKATLATLMDPRLS